MEHFSSTISAKYTLEDASLCDKYILVFFVWLRKEMNWWNAWGSFAKMSVLKSKAFKFRICWNERFLFWNTSPSCSYSSHLNWRFTTFNMLCCTWCPSTCFGKEVRPANNTPVPPLHLGIPFCLGESQPLGCLPGSWAAVWMCFCSMLYARHQAVGNEHRQGLLRIWWLFSEPSFVGEVGATDCLSQGVGLYHSFSSRLVLDGTAYTLSLTSACAFTLPQCTV